MLLCSATASPSHTAVVHEILQRGPYASILGEGYAGLARRPADRAHSLPPSSRRAAPPIYPDLIYDRHSCILQTNFPTKVQAQKYLLTNWPIIEKMARDALA